MTSTIPDTPAVVTHAELFRALANLFEQGVPVPHGVFAERPGHIEMQYSSESGEDVEAMAEAMGLGPCASIGRIYDSGPRAWRSYEASGIWRGWRVRPWCGRNEPAGPVWPEAGA